MNGKSNKIFEDVPVGLWERSSVIMKVSSPLVESQAGTTDKCSLCLYDEDRIRKLVCLGHGYSEQQLRKRCQIDGEIHGIFVASDFLVQTGHSPRPASSQSPDPANHEVITPTSGNNNSSSKDITSSTICSEN
jgi:hypothetical protein